MDDLNFFAITYGPSGTGKTLATIRAFPDALFISPRGGTACASFLGVTPKTIAPSSVSEVTALIKNKATAKKYSAVIIDDFSLLADTELDQQKKNARDKWAAHDVFNHQVYDLRDVAREAPFPVILTMHERSPRQVENDQGKRTIPGSPLIAGWQLPEKLPAYADFVARVVYSTDALGSWPYVYQTGPDPDYITKNRVVNSPDKFPLNLRVLLLDAGYTLPRPKEFQWMEDVVQKVAPVLQPILQQHDKESLQTLLTKIFKQLSTSHSQVHIRWALMDAIDTATLANHKSTLVDKFITNISNTLGENNDVFI